MALPNITAAQLQRIATLIGWQRANHVTILSALDMTASLAAAFAQDPNLPPADAAVWAQLASDCTTAKNTYPASG